MGVFHGITALAGYQKEILTGASLVIAACGLYLQRCDFWRMWENRGGHRINGAN